MPLFPAYTDPQQSNEEQSSGQVEDELIPEQESDWLKNDSYKPAETKTSSPECVETSDVPVSQERKPASTKEKKTKKKREKLKTVSPPKIEVKWTFLDTRKRTPGPQWIEFRRATPENRTYAGMYKAHVAKFFRNTHQVLGLDQQMKPKRAADRYYQRVKRRRKELNGPSLLPQKLGGIGKSPSFVPLSVDIEEVPGENPGAEWSLDQDPVWRKNADFQRQLDQNCHNVPLWLEFVEFQKIFYSHKSRPVSGSSSVSDPNISSSRPTLDSAGLAQHQLTILEKAIGLNPSCVQLQLRKLDLVAGCADWEWDKTETLVEEWDTLLSVHSDNLDVWRAYINSIVFKGGPNFTLGKALAAYDRCLGKLSSILEAPMYPGTSKLELEAFLLSIHSDRANLLAQGGQVEKAIGCWQAIIEYNFYCPSALSNATRTELHNSFEDYWAASLPRFGQEDVVHWSSHFATASEQTAESGTSQVASAANLDALEAEILREAMVTADEKLLWVDLEELRCNAQWLPCLDTNPPPEDPDRIVLIDDVSLSLIRFENPTMLLIEFLRFLGADGPNGETSVNSFQTEGGAPINQFLSESDSLRPLAPARNWLGLDDFINGVFDHIDLLESISGQHRLIFVTIRFRWESNRFFSGSGVTTSQKDRLKKYKKVAKSFLAAPRNRNCFLLYVIYVQNLIQLQATSDADQVCDALLRNYKNDIFELDSNSVELVSLSHLILLKVKLLLGQVCPLADVRSNKAQDSVDSFLEMLLRTGSLPRAYGALSTSAAPSSGRKEIIEALWSKRLQPVSQGSEKNWILNNFGSSYACLACLCLSHGHLLSKSGTLHSLRTKYDSFLSSSNGSFDQLLISECYVDLVRSFVQMEKPVFAMKILRETYRLAIEHCPASFRFLTEFSDLYLRGDLKVEIRRFFDQKQRTDLIWWLSALRNEFRSSNTCTASNYRIHNLFQRAIECCEPRSELLGRLYLHFATLSSKTEVTWEPLRQCPWSKSLAVAAARYWPGNLESLTDWMIEKEIRLRLPLEELDLLKSALHTAETEHSGT